MHRRWIIGFSWLVGLLLLLGLDALAQDASVGDALRSMAAAAGSVFVGQVVAITRKGGVVEVEFRVEQPIAGASGSNFTLREWAGLWPPGMQRYHLGDRAMVFVQAASSAGLATPVRGAEGVVPVVLQAGGAEALLDVSRLDTAIVRHADAPLTASAAGIALRDAVALVGTAASPVFHEPKRLPLPVRTRKLPPHTPVRMVPGGGGMLVQPIVGAFDAR